MCFTALPSFHSVRLLSQPSWKTAPPWAAAACATAGDGPPPPPSAAPRAEPPAATAAPRAEPPTRAAPESPFPVMRRAFFMVPAAPRRDRRDNGLAQARARQLVRRARRSAAAGAAV